ncbi:MAG: AMP-binding protein, partial [Anaerolineae bacterium]
MSFLETFLRNANQYPDKVALEFLDPPLQRVTYAGLDQLSLRTAGYLHSIGLQPGDRVALQLTKSLEFIALHLAVLRMNAISLPLNLAYPPNEVEYFLQDSGARFFFGIESAKQGLAQILGRLPELQHAVFLDPGEPSQFQSLVNPSEAADLSGRAIDPNDTAIIIYTSGTTGRPKGAETTHANLTANLDALHSAWGWTPDDILLHLLPIFHIHGLFVALHGALHAGATTLLMREFNAEKTLANLVEKHCTVFMAVPTIHQRLLDLP